MQCIHLEINCVTALKRICLHLIRFTIHFMCTTFHLSIISGLSQELWIETREDGAFLICQACSDWTFETPSFWMVNLVQVTTAPAGGTASRTMVT